MPDSTKKSTIQFVEEFLLSVTNKTYPPGEYLVFEEEELIEGISWLAYRHSATYIQVPAIGSKRTSTQMIPIDHEELAAILEQNTTIELNKHTPIEKLDGANDNT